MPTHDHDAPDHGAVEHLDAAATLPEREPVRIYGTMPTAILGTAGAIVALGAGSPRAALGWATAIVVVSAILELVRSRVSPAVINPFVVPTPNQGDGPAMMPPGSQPDTIVDERPGATTTLAPEAQEQHERD